MLDRAPILIFVEVASVEFILNLELLLEHLIQLSIGLLLELFF